MADTMPPDVEAALADRASLRGGDGDFDGAIEDCTHALAHKPDSYGAYANRAVAYLASVSPAPPWTTCRAPSSCGPTCRRSTSAGPPRARHSAT